MADYSQITDFSAKDALTSGDPNKLIKGSDVDAELDAISTAIATKYDSASLTTWADENAGIVGDLQATADPNADRILFWDDSAGAASLLSLEAHFQISGTELQPVNLAQLDTDNTFTGQQTIQNASPFLYFSETGVTADNSVWRFAANTETFYLQVADDAISSISTIFSVDRTGTTVDTVNFSGTSLQHLGVQVATLGANTFTANQTISANDPVISLTNPSGSSWNGLLQFVEGSTQFGNLTASKSSNLMRLQKYNAAGSAATSYLDLHEDGTITHNADTVITARDYNDVAKTAVESVTSSTTLQNDNELFAPVSAFTRYSFKAIIRMTAGTTEDFKFTFVGPTGATGGFTYVSAASENSFGTAVTIPGLGGTIILIHAYGWVETGATAGNLQLQWAQDTSGATATSVYANSHLIVSKETP